MKDYYEILQVNEKASIEIIEKAYKTLAKKYHPDLQTDETKRKFAEEKLKDLNEAYKVLSDDFLREQYDEELQIERIKSYKKQLRYQNDNIRFQDSQNYQETKSSANKTNTINKRNTNSETQQEYQKQKAEVGTFSSMTNLVKEIIANRPKTGEKRKITKKDLMAVGITIIIVIIIGIILWFIPFTNGFMRELIIENPLFSWIWKLF